MKLFLRALSPLGQLFFLILFSFLSLLLFQFFGALIAKLFFGIYPDDLINIDFTSIEYIDVTMLLAFLNAIGMFLLPALTLASFLSDEPNSFLKINKIPSVNLVLNSIFLALLSLPIINYLGTLNLMVDLPQWMLDEESKREVLINSFLTQKSVWLNLFLLALIPAFAEEFFFRGLMQKFFIKFFKHPHHIGIIVTAIIFSAMHIQFAGFLPRFFMGLILGYLYHYSKSLWPSVILHFCNNAISVVLAIMILKKDAYKTLDEIGNSISLEATLLAFASVGLIAFILFKIRKASMQQ